MHREMNLELPRFPEIVGIQERDVVASDFVQPAVARDRCARVLLRDVTNRRSELSAQLPGVIRRPVVDNQDLKRWVALL